MPGPPRVEGFVFRVQGLRVSVGVRGLGFRGFGSRVLHGAFGGS